MDVNDDFHPALDEIIEAGRDLSKQVDQLQFSAPVSHVYNPLNYARESHETYLRRFTSPHCRVIFLGMNPGPWGMAQTGVPFGEVAAVRDWMGIETRVARPAHEHPKRPVEGFRCRRSEVSGRRLWGLFAARFGTAASFFREHLVLNHCPLVFMEEGGKNRTPDKLPALEQDPLMQCCDAHLRRMVQILQPHWLVGIGAYAETRATTALSGLDIRFTRILHPSPASPAANRDWSGTATRQLIEAGVWSDMA